MAKNNNLLIVEMSSSQLLLEQSDNKDYILEGIFGQIDQKNKNAYFNRALSYAKLNNLEKTCLDWEQAAILGHEKAQIYLDERCK